MTGDRLQQFLDAMRTEPFRWGQHDCAMFAARWRDAMTGTDLATQEVRSYGVTSALAFRRLTRSKSLRTLVEKFLGPPLETEPERGDVVELSHNGVRGLGIAVPPVVLVADDTGFRPVPMSFVTAVWRIA